MHTPDATERRGVLRLSAALSPAGSVAHPFMDAAGVDLEVDPACASWDGNPLPRRGRAETACWLGAQHDSPPGRPVRSGL